MITDEETQMISPALHLVSCIIHLTHNSLLSAFIWYCLTRKKQFPTFCSVLPDSRWTDATETPSLTKLCPFPCFSSRVNVWTYSSLCPVKPDFTTQSMALCMTVSHVSRWALSFAFFCLRRVSVSDAILVPDMGSRWHGEGQVWITHVLTITCYTKSGAAAAHL